MLIRKPLNCIEYGSGDKKYLGILTFTPTWYFDSSVYWFYSDDFYYCINIQII